MLSVVWRGRRMGGVISGAVRGPMESSPFLDRHHDERCLDRISNHCACSVTATDRVQCLSKADFLHLENYSRVAS